MYSNVTGAIGELGRSVVERAYTDLLRYSRVEGSLVSMDRYIRTGEWHLPTRCHSKDEADVS